MPKVSVDAWATVGWWQVKGRPATQKHTAAGWIGVPGSENPAPGTQYRLAIVWGPKLAVNGVENYLQNPELRVVFEGWRISGKNLYRSSLQFYTDSGYTNPTATAERVHIPHPGLVFQPYNADIVDYAHFKVTTARNRAWRMRYNIGVYGAVYQGAWGRVTAL